MTWWDHETNSIWTQPWGRALTGELKGTQLKLIPFSLIPFQSWVDEHPNTLVMTSPGGFYPRQIADDDFVLGVAIGDVARGYYYPTVAEEIIVHDTLNGVDLVIHTNSITRSSHIYGRTLNDGTVLTFTGDVEKLIDEQTGSIWNPALGLAEEGPLAGQVLRELPYISSFDWAWLDFFPHSDFYGEPPRP